MANNQVSTKANDTRIDLFNVALIMAGSEYKLPNYT